MTESNIEYDNKNLSPLFQDALRELTITGKTLKEKIEHVIEVGRNEGMSDLLIGNLIRSAINKSMSKSTVLRYLPKEMKDQSKVRQFCNQNNANDYKNVIVESSTINKKSIENDIRIQDNIIEEEEEDIHRHCNERIARLEKEIAGLKEEIKRLQAENAELKKPRTQPLSTTTNPLFSSKKIHDDYFQNKYRIKKVK